MTTIREFLLGNAISVTVTDEAFDIQSAPPSSKELMSAHTPVKSLIGFQDMWKAHVGIFTYANGENVVEFSWSPKPVPPPFNAAVGRGRMTMKRVGDNYVFLMRALRHNNRDWPTLTQITWDEMDQLMNGDAKDFFKSLGEVTFGRYGDMVDNSRTMANGIGVKVPVSEHAVIVGIFVATRALAVLKNLSK